jgi:maltose alpha-D-glucosyltransferase/alpha-amylase
VLDLPLPRSVLAHRFDTPSGAVLLLHNLADQPVKVDVSTLEIGENAYQMFADSTYDPLPRKVTELPLTGWGYRWIRLQGGF